MNEQDFQFRMTDTGETLSQGEIDRRKVEFERAFWGRAQASTEMARMGLTSSYLVNGGAATALLAAFAPSIATGGLSGLHWGVWSGLAAFVFGVVCTFAATITAERSQSVRAPLWDVANFREVDRVAGAQKIADIYQVAAYSFAIAAIVCFAVGCVLSAIGLWSPAELRSRL